MSDEETEVVKAPQPPQESKSKKKGAVERFFLWASDNKVEAGIIITFCGAVFAAIFGVIGSQVNEALKAPETVEAVVRGAPHKSSDPSSAYKSVWEVTVTYAKGEELKGVGLQFPFEGMAHIKYPRKKDIEVVDVSAEGIQFEPIRAQDQVYLTVWSDASVESVATERIRVTGQKDAGVVEVESPPINWLHVFWGTILGSFLSFLATTIVFRWAMQDLIKKWNGEIEDLRRQSESRDTRLAHVERVEKLSEAVMSHAAASIFLMFRRAKEITSLVTDALAEVRRDWDSLDDEGRKGALQIVSEQLEEEFERVRVEFKGMLFTLSKGTMLEGMTEEEMQAWMLDAIADPKEEA